MEKKKFQFPVRSVVVTAMLSAIAFLLMFIEFSIPIMPFFIKLDISDLPELIGAFALGPWYGAIIALLKNLLHILIKGTSTSGVGELCNFLLGAVFALVAGYIYKFIHNKKGAIIASVASAAAMAIISVPINYFITYPAYVKFFGMPLDAIIGAYQAILPSMGGLLECLIIFNVPFTLVKGLICAVFAILIYKPLSVVLHGKR